MKITTKMMLLALTSSSIVLGWFGGGGCGQFWGNLLGQAIVLRGID